MSKIFTLCLGLALVAATSPATASGRERRLPTASSILTAKLIRNQSGLGHGPARVLGDKWGRGTVTYSKPQRGASMPHMAPR